MEAIIQFIADGTVFLVVILGVYALTAKIPNNHKYAAYCRILMAGLTAFLVAKFMATLYQPSGGRPFELLGVEPGAAYLDNPGFPSDHALFVTAILLAVWFETKARAIALALLVLVVLVGVGRVAALVHTPLDVLGGMLAAMIGALWYLTVPAKSHAHPKNRKQ
jgi:membrane-associated phospholipid phosphatase